MIELNISTLIHQPVKQVFDFVSLPENNFQWQYGTLSANRLSEGISRIGTVFRSIGHLFGRRVIGTYEVIEYIPNKRYGFRSLDGPLSSLTSYILEAVDGGTQVSVSLQATIIDLLQGNEGALEKEMKKQLRENLALLKNILEAEDLPLIGALHSRSL